MNKNARQKIINKLQEVKKDAELLKKANEQLDLQSAEDPNTFAKKFHDIIVDEVVDDIFSNLKD